MGRLGLAIAGLAVLLVAAGARASEDAPPRDFPFTWTTATLAPGAKGLEAWLTPRIARADPQFSLVEARAVYAVGLLPSLDTQLSLDLNFQSNATLTTVDSRVGSLWRWAPFKADGPVGFGALGRVALGLDVAELEARVLLDKQLGKVLLGANASFSRSFFWNGRTGVDTRLEESAAVRYAVGDRATVGLELRAKSGFLRGDYQGTGFYVGPTLGFHVRGLWLSLGLEAQVGADKAPADRGNGEPLEVRDNEHVVGRLVFGTSVR